MTQRLNSPKSPGAIFSIPPILFAIPLIKEITLLPEDLQALERSMLIRNIRKGEHLLLAGETESQFRFLNKGLIRHYYLQRGREITTQFSGPGEIACSFGSFTAQQPGSYYLEALENTNLLCWEKKEFDSLLIQHERFAAFFSRIVSVVCLQKERRERELMNAEALGRLQYFFDMNRELFGKIAQVQIASYLNIRPETLSHLKKKLVW